MTALTSCTVTGTSLPNSAGTLTFENLALWNAEVYYKLFKNKSFQARQYVDRVHFAMKTLYEGQEDFVDYLVYTLAFPLNVDWQTSSGGIWLKNGSPDTTVSTVPVAYQVIKT